MKQQSTFCFVITSCRLIHHTLKSIDFVRGEKIQIKILMKPYSIGDHRAVDEEEVTEGEEVMNVVLGVVMADGRRVMKGEMIIPLVDNCS